MTDRHPTVSASRIFPIARLRPRDQGICHSNEIPLQAALIYCFSRPRDYLLALARLCDPLIDLYPGPGLLCLIACERRRDMTTIL